MSLDFYELKCNHDICIHHRTLIHRGKFYSFCYELDEWFKCMKEKRERER